MKTTCFVIALAFTMAFQILNAQQWTTSGNNIYNSNSGNVGIGTTNPANKLDILAGVVNIQRISPGNNGINMYYRCAEYLTLGQTNYGFSPYIAFNAVVTTSDVSTSSNMITPYYVGNSTTPGTGLIIRSDAGKGRLRFFQQNYITNAGNGDGTWNLAGFTEVMTLMDNGYLGLGTSNPSEKLSVVGNTSVSGKVYIGSITPGANTLPYSLAVNGSAIFTKAVVRLYNNWPDYVFAKNYQPMPLKDLEKYILQYGHLPEIPSAEEIQKQDGVDLGEMNTKLLKKVEELTLYVIQLQKENDEIKEELKKLKEKQSQ